MIFNLAKIAAGIVAFLLVRRAGATTPTPATPTPATPTPATPTPATPTPATPTPIPRTPGDGFDNPLPSSQLKPGFRGFFQVQAGDTLIGLARRLGRPDSDWKKFTLLTENQWAVALCTPAVRQQYYMGMAGITLTRQYGNSAGLDCVAPGYGPGYPLLSTARGVFPVLYWS